jgi:hypothetical protein
MRFSTLRNYCNVSAENGQVLNELLIFWHMAIWFLPHTILATTQFSRLDSACAFGQARSVEQPTSIPEPQSDVPKHATSLVSRMFNVFVVPGDVFEEAKNRPPSLANWLVPLLLSAVSGTLAVFILFSQPAIVQQIHEQQAKAFDDQVKAGKMTRDQADKAEAMAEKFAGPSGMKFFGTIGVVFSSVVQLFWWALVLWLLGLIFLKSRFSYLKAVEVAGLATMISVLGTIVTLLLSVSLGKATTPSLAFFVSHFDPKNILHLLLAAANIFSLWLVGVMAVGLSRLSGARFSTAFFLTTGYWLALQLFFIAIGILAAHLVPAAK